MGTSNNKDKGLDMKGIFYSVMIAMFMIPIIALIVFYSQVTTSQNIAANIRANEMQYFSESIEEDLLRFLQINGKRAVVAAVNFTLTTGVGLEDARTNLTVIIENGTLNGTKIFDDQKNLSEWIQNISVIASRSGFGINLTLLSFNVTQNDSFSVLFSTLLYLNISDTSASVGISKNMSAAAAVSIEGVVDPLYQIKTNGAIFKTIKKSPYIPFNKITLSSLEFTNLTNDILNNSYHDSTQGPSFLDRLEGKITLSPQYGPYGLESFVYLPDFIGAGLPVNTLLSDLDYQYWANVHGYYLKSSYQTGIYNWFRISTDNSYIENDLLNTTS